MSELQYLGVFSEWGTRGAGYVSETLMGTRTGCSSPFNQLTASARIFFFTSAEEHRRKTFEREVLKNQGKSKTAFYRQFCVADLTNLCHTISVAKLIPTYFAPLEAFIARVLLYNSVAAPSRQSKHRASHFAQDGNLLEAFTACLKLGLRDIG